MLFLTPMYINLILLFSIANLHDVSWGNRDTDSKESINTQKNLEVFRAKYLIFFIFGNVVYGYGITAIGQGSGKFFVLALSIIYSFSVIAKLLIALIATVKHLCTHARIERKISKAVKEGLHRNNTVNGNNQVQNSHLNVGGDEESKNEQNEGGELNFESGEIYDFDQNCEKI